MSDETNDKTKCVRCGKEMDPLKASHTCKPQEQSAATPIWLPIIPAMNQRQDSLMNQLEDLIVVANRLGMQDAASWLADRIHK
jgi:hypothetical protein